RGADAGPGARSCAPRRRDTGRTTSALPGAGHPGWLGAGAAAGAIAEPAVQVADKTDRARTTLAGRSGVAPCARTRAGPQPELSPELVHRAARPRPVWPAGPV